MMKKLSLSALLLVALGNMATAGATSKTKPAPKKTEARCYQVKNGKFICKITGKEMKKPCCK